MGTVRKRDWLLNHLHTGDGLRNASGVISISTGPAAITFHLLTEAGDALLTEAGDFLDIEHV